MRQRTRLVLGQMLLICLLMPAHSAWAWIDTGHKLVAMIAWDELTPAARAKVIELLKQHPRYERDLLAGLPAGSDEAAAERHAFAMAATWPDMVKAQAHPMHFTANHPEWHYIDLPYRPEGGDQPAPAKPSGDENKPGPHDVVEALAKNMNDLRSPATPAPDKAIAICWVLHLGGDIHQPLHAITLISPQFPDGDKGGNALLVLRDPPYMNTLMNLHLIWDSLAGNYKSDEPIAYLAAGLRNDPNLSRERMKDRLAVKDLGAWARESHALAIEYAYLNGTLKGAVAQRGGQAAPDVQVPGLPPGYLQNAERVAFKQIALAGYRVADLLNAACEGK